MAFIKNKYLITGLLFLLWMFFFDPKDIGTTIERHQKLGNLRQTEIKLSEQIDEAQKELTLLKTSAETIERYAREKYFMKKDNEELFIVKTP